MPDGHARLRMCLEHEYDVRVRDLTPFFEMPDRAVYRADTDRPGLVVRVFPHADPVFGAGGLRRRRAAVRGRGRDPGGAARQRARATAGQSSGTA